MRAMRLAAAALMAAVCGCESGSPGARGVAGACMAKQPCPENTFADPLTATAVVVTPSTKPDLSSFTPPLHPELP